MPEVVYITDAAEQRLSAYLRLAEGEISGFGLVRKQEDFLVVHEIFILDQESGSAHTELDTDAMQELLYQLLKGGSSPEEVTLWWHSHGMSSTFFSGTDDDTIDRFALFGRPWMLSLVSNRKLQHRLRLDFYDPIRATVDDIELRMFSRRNDKIDRNVEREISKKVRKPIPQPFQQYGMDWYKNKLGPKNGGRKGNTTIDEEIEAMMREAPGLAIF